MTEQSRDREIVERLFGKMDEWRFVYDTEAKLTTLNFQGLQLEKIPEELKELKDLQRLYLNDNQLNEIPKELGELTNLRRLDLQNNQLTQIPKELGNLRSLQVLLLNNNKLREVPEELGNLIGLQELSLHDNELRSVPATLGGLINLMMLFLQNNQLGSVPAELGRLVSLQELWLSGNQLIEVPTELGELANLRKLFLNNNQLIAISKELKGLTKLRLLYLSNNQLTGVPAEIGQLDNLTALDLDNNPNLLTPPPEIVALGTSHVKEFLQALERNSIIRYESKLLLVGEGGTGKTSLLRLLRHEEFINGLPTSHGIEVSTLRFPHPHKPKEEIILNTWDFGGQHIYHATHQFFLTKRSLYMVVWNARLGAEQGRLNFWLDTIQALAPDSPVLLVATHADERIPDLNYQLYKDAYPQVVGSFSISNKDGRGLGELKAVLIRYAAGLPLVGQPWPEKWVEAEIALLSRKQHHIEAKAYIGICVRKKVERKIARGSLGSYLHDLGKILYFQDDYVLSNLVILKPNWVTKAISYVLEDEATRQAGGILTHTDLPRIWAHGENGRAYDSYLYPIFLRLMERFDLSYQLESDMLGEPVTRSLIPQLLPHQPPDGLLPWPEVPLDGQTKVEMRYRFDFVPAGIMSWFIVRTHRYTRHQHWREGVILEYRGHFARVELNPMLRELRMVAWGMQPHTFFTILKDTLDLILARFEGLRVRREVPCICHWEDQPGELCKEAYRYEEDLLRRVEAGKPTIECPASYKDVSVLKLLYGIHMSTDAQVREDIRRLSKEVRNGFTSVQGNTELILQRLGHQSELITRNFLRQWNLEMKKFEAECPGTFLLLPQTLRLFNPQKWIGESYRLQLMCQHPPGPHCVGEGYELHMPKVWWVSVAPWLRHLITFLKYGVPMGHEIGAVIDGVSIKNLGAQINLLETIVKDLADLDLPGTRAEMERSSRVDQEQVTGSALRVLHVFLDRVDESHNWGGLDKVITPEGNILWLCMEHRKQYEAKPLQLPL